MKDIDMGDITQSVTDEELLLQRVVLLIVSDEVGLQPHIRGNVQESILLNLLDQAANDVENLLAEEYEDLMIDIELEAILADSLKIKITVTQGDNTLTVPKELSNA